MADLTITPASVAPVRIDEQRSGPTAVAMEAGVVVYVDSNGKYALANGNAAPQAVAAGITLEKATTAGETVTVMRKGLLDVGNALSALAFQAPVYLSNTSGGILGDGAGSVSLVVGTVVPVWGATTADKLLRVNL